MQSQNPSIKSGVKDAAQDQPLTKSPHRTPEDPANDADMDKDSSAESENAHSSVDTEDMHHQGEGVWRNQYPINQTGQQET